MLELVTTTVRNFTLSVSHYIYLVLSAQNIPSVQNIWELQGSGGAVTAGKKTQRDLLRAADLQENVFFSAFLLCGPLKVLGMQSTVEQCKPTNNRFVFHPAFFKPRG